MHRRRSGLVGQLSGSSSLVAEIIQVLIENKTQLELALNNTNYIIEFISPVNISFSNLNHGTQLPIGTSKSLKGVKLKDEFGAIWYTLIVLFFYGFIVFVVLIIRVKPKKNRDEPGNQDRDMAESLMRRGMREQTVTKSILEQLKDTEYRAQAWRIYASDKRESRSNHLNKSLLLREPDILKDIEKRIETIDRHNEFIITPQTSRMNDSHTQSTDEDRDVILRKLLQFRQSIRGKFSTTVQPNQQRPWRGQRPPLFSYRSWTQSATRSLTYLNRTVRPNTLALPVKSVAKSHENKLTVKRMMSSIDDQRVYHTLPPQYLMSRMSVESSFTIIPPLISSINNNQRCTRPSCFEVFDLNDHIPLESTVV